MTETEIVGVVRGRQEVGPRALGHRSLLLDARRPELQVRVNLLKRRQWYRPVAPMVLEEDVSRLFVNTSSIVQPCFSPYMSRAPHFTPAAGALFPAVMHIDGTARVQTVSAADDNWTFELLRAVQRLIGHGVLGNTSMNVRGKPIVNRGKYALELLRTEPEISALVLGDWLIPKRSCEPPT